MKISDVIEKMGEADSRIDMYKTLLAYLHEAMPSDTQPPDPSHVLAGFDQLCIEEAVQAVTDQITRWEEEKSSYEELEVHDEDGSRGE